MLTSQLGALWRELGTPELGAPDSASVVTLSTLATQALCTPSEFLRSVPKFALNIAGIVTEFQESFRRRDGTV